jgi:hypothetical protein
MKKFAIFAMGFVFSVFSSVAAFAAQVVDLGKPETLSQYGAVEQAPGADNGLVFMAHQDVVVKDFPEALKKIDHEGGSALSAADLPLEILRGREVTIWYSRKATPDGFVEETTTPHVPTAPTSDDNQAPAPTTVESGDQKVVGPEVTSLEGLEKVGQVRERTNSVWKDFAPTSDGRFGGELVAFKVTGLNSQERAETFRAGLGYIVAEADVLENRDTTYSNTIARLLTLNLPGFESSSEKYVDGNIRVTLYVAANRFFYGGNVFKITGAEQLMTDPNGGCVYNADSSVVGPISIFMKSELADPKDGDGGSGSGGGGCDAGMGLPALLAVALFLLRKSC